MSPPLPLATRLGQVLRWTIGIAVIVGYALLSHATASASGSSVMGAMVALGPMFGISFLMAWRAKQRWPLLGLWGVVCTLLYASRQVLITHYHWVFLLEHVGTYSALGATFGLTLRQGHMPIISGLAQKVHGDLTPGLARYTRAVTWAWTLYFAGVATLSLLLFGLAPLPVWSGFAYLLGVPILVLMFLVEYAVRCWVLPREDRTGLISAIRAYRQSTVRAP